jgi:hypothetical protein
MKTQRVWDNLSHILEQTKACNSVFSEPVDRKNHYSKALLLCLIKKKLETISESDYKTNNYRWKKYNKFMWNTAFKNIATPLYLNLDRFSFKAYPKESSQVKSLEITENSFKTAKTTIDKKKETKFLNYLKYSSKQIKGGSNTTVDCWKIIETIHIYKIKLFKAKPIKI